MREKGDAPSTITRQQIVSRTSTLAGASLGLYTSRVIAEGFGGPRSVIVLLPLTLACVALGLLIAHLMRRGQFSPWPLILLLSYVVYPHPAPMVAGGVFLFVIVTLAAPHVPSNIQTPWVEAGVFLASLGLYVRTLAPTVLPADSGEFQLVAPVLGIAHPPGYALYTLLGRLFTLIPLGDAAYRMNLFGAVCGALTLALLVHLVRQASGSTGAALIAAAMLGLSPTFWAQGTTANIRSLTAAFTVLSADLLLHWEEREEPKYLIAFAACFGLGVGHHASLGLLGFPFLIYIIARAPRILVQPRRWTRPLLTLLASFTVLLYLPLRSGMGAPFDPTPIRSWSDFVNHVLALGFSGDMFYYRTLPDLIARLGVWVEIVRLQFGPLLPWATLLAAVGSLIPRRNRAPAGLLVGIWAINTLSAVTYKAPQTVEYLLPSYVAMAALLGYGLATARHRMPRWAGALLIALLVIAIAQYGTTHYDDFRQLHEDRSARTYAESILEDAPPDTLVLSNWHHATVFWYLQTVEGVRPDVEVRYVHPEGATPNQEVWLKRIGDNVEERPVVVTNRFHAFEDTDYYWTPLHDAWLVHREPPSQPPQEMVERETTFGTSIRLLGYTIEKTELTPGQEVCVRVYWQPTGILERPHSSFVQLLGPRGVVGQDDIAHETDCVPHALRVDTYRFPLLLHTPPGEYQLIMGFYYAQGENWERLPVEGQDHLVLRAIDVHPMKQIPATLHGMTRPFANGLHIRGADYDQSVAGQTRVYLHLGQSTPSNEGSQIHLLHDGETIVQQAVPDLPAGATTTLALDVPADLRSLSLALTTPAGRAIPRLGPWHHPLSGNVHLSLPRGNAHYVPLGGKMVFLGLDPLPQNATPGEAVQLTPHFFSLRPLVNDYSISVGLKDRASSWERKADGTPAMGGIPTLKWLRGWRVRDPREVVVPEDAPVGTAEATVSVYDAFTLHPLHVLDERLAREGYGIHLSVNTLQIEE
ncbi:MAG: protein O-mannosyl-transferase family [Anaerolineales bacterium]